ncbi:hypothetical protein E2320_000064, partial [Naja naja]
MPQLAFMKFKKAKKRFIKICKYETFVSCLVGLYTCRWQDQNRKKIKPGLWCCNKGECMYFSLLAFTFSFSFVFLYMYSFINLGYWFHWSTFLLFLAVFVFSYLLFLIFIAVLLLFESQELEMHWCHKVTAPFLHVVAIFTTVLLAWPVALHFFRMLILTPYLVVLIYLIFVPLGMYSPCIREKGTLGPKPALIGHRGAPMLAPENTEMSYDGVPFLMHDHSLTRTTDIEHLYPYLKGEDPAYFTWDFLENLNAGKWFLK